MKIGLDLRFIGDDLYSFFIVQLTQGLILNSKENTFIIYTNLELKGFNFINVEIKNVNIKNFSIKEQITFLKIITKDNNNLMLFFNEYKPIFYKGAYFILINSLKNIFYNNFSNYYKKYSFLFLIEKNLNKANKIICFDNNTKEELIEKFNINSTKINILPAFFPSLKILDNNNDININILTKYNIKNKYFIYSGGEGLEKNYEKLIYLFEKLKKNNKNIDLVFLGEDVTKNIYLRNLVLDLNIQNNIHFVGILKPNEKRIFYKNSLGTIFPSFYEPFPFNLTESLFLNTPIISSNLENIKNIFKSSIYYFSPISVNSLYEQIIGFLDKKNKIVNYDLVIEKYNKENSIRELLEIIK